MQNDHFNKIFWFCVCCELAGLVLLAALIWIPVPKENQSMANIAIGFDTATIIGIPMSFLLGGNALPPKKQIDAPGTATADISATITTDPSQTNSQTNKN